MAPSKVSSLSYEDERRRCTDLFCCVLLVLLCATMLGIAIYCWAGNNFSKLTTPYDAEGKGCGVDYPDYPLIYFVAPEYDVTTFLCRHFGERFVSRNVQLVHKPR